MQALLVIMWKFHGVERVLPLIFLECGRSGPLLPFMWTRRCISVRRLSFCRRQLHSLLDDLALRGFIQDTTRSWLSFWPGTKFIHCYVDAMNWTMLCVQDHRLSTQASTQPQRPCTSATSFLSCVFFTFKSEVIGLSLL